MFVFTLAGPSTKMTTVAFDWLIHFRIFFSNSFSNHGGNQLLYKHFNLPDPSILLMKVRILEKIYHPTNNPNLSNPFRQKREEYWIRQLGTAAPYGCNDHIDSIGNLTNPGCQSVNVLICLTEPAGDLEVMAQEDTFCIISLRYMTCLSMGSCRS